MKRKLMFSLTVIAIVLMGILIGVRASASTGVAYDPSDEGYCEIYGITFNTDQVEAIYLHPETILADPEAFFSRDIASLMLVQRHMEENDPLEIDRWVRQVERIADLPMDEREQQLPYMLAREVVAGKEWVSDIPPAKEIFPIDSLKVDSTFLGYKEYNGERCAVLKLAFSFNLLPTPLKEGVASELPEVQEEGSMKLVGGLVFSLSQRLPIVMFRRQEDIKESTSQGKQVMRGSSEEEHIAKLVSVSGSSK